MLIELTYLMKIVNFRNVLQLDNIENIFQRQISNFDNVIKSIVLDSLINCLTIYVLSKHFIKFW